MVRKRHNVGPVEKAGQLGIGHIAVDEFDVLGEGAVPDLFSRELPALPRLADGEETPDNYQRMWWLARDLVRTGVLQRWAYVSYFAVCAPGQEEATFERMKNLIALAVPEYQFPPAGR